MRSSKQDVCFSKKAMLLNIKTANLDVWCDRCSKMMAIMTAIFSQMRNSNSGRVVEIYTLKIELVKQDLYIKKAHGTLLAIGNLGLYCRTRHYLAVRTLAPHLIDLYLS